MDALAAVARLTDALARATTLDQVYAAALDALQQSLGVPRASILLFDENDVMSFVAWRGLSDGYRTAVTGHTPWRRDSTDVEPICIRDAYDYPSLAGYRPVFDAEGIRSLAFFPLVHRGSVIGKFMLYHGEPHDFTEEAIALARTIAGQIAFGVTRIRTEVELQRERDRLDDIIANVPGVVWETVGEVGVDHRVTFVSKQIESLVGFTASEWYENPRFSEQVIVDQREISRGVPEIVHYQMRTRDGRLIWVEVRTARKEVDGKPVILGVTMDITRQKEAELRSAFLDKASALLAASLDYETTLAHVAELTVQQLADWCTIDIRNESGEVQRLFVTHRDPARAAAVERMYNITSDKERSGTILHAIDQGQSTLMREMDWEAFDQYYADQPETLEALHELGIASYMVVPLLAGGRSFGAISIISANDQRLFEESDLELAKELGRRAGYAIDNARLYRQAQEANRAKDEFLATLSHELRTPMTATLGWATMLQLPDLPPETMRIAIETIERSTRAQAKLIDDILDVSRIVTGKLQLSVAPMNMRTVVEAALEAIRPSITAKGLELRASFTETTGAPVGDAARLQQVIWNLLSNSVKFTPPGGTIYVALEQPAGDQMRISVRDTGMGIAPQFLPFIFERFRQADSTSTRKHGGLGLGLAIVKNIVELHGGSVSATSEGAGRGATFTLTLPIANATAVAASGVTAEASAPLALSGISVLLVEDEDDTRYMLSAALQSFGARVTAVRSVSAAMDVMQTNAPTVVVSDIGIPGEDGFSLILKIRSGTVDRIRNVPAIALTAYARPEDRDRILGSGYGYYLAKPIDPMIVVKTVREAAGR